MYADPKHIRDREVKVWLDDASFDLLEAMASFDLLEAMASFSRRQRAVLARELIEQGLKALFAPKQLRSRRRRAEGPRQDLMQEEPNELTVPLTTDEAFALEVGATVLGVSSPEELAALAIKRALRERAGAALKRSGNVQALKRGRSDE